MPSGSSAFFYLSENTSDDGMAFLLCAWDTKHPSIIVAIVQVSVKTDTIIWRLSSDKLTAFIGNLFEKNRNCIINLCKYVQN
jgi:hypothetical protein